MAAGAADELTFCWAGLRSFGREWPAGGVITRLYLGRDLAARQLPPAGDSARASDTGARGPNVAAAAADPFPAAATSERKLMIILEESGQPGWCVLRVTQLAPLGQLGRRRATKLAASLVAQSGPKYSEFSILYLDEILSGPL